MGSSPGDILLVVPTQATVRGLQLLMQNRESHHAPDEVEEAGSSDPPDEDGARPRIRTTEPGQSGVPQHEPERHESQDHGLHEAKPCPIDLRPQVGDLVFELPSVHRHGEGERE